MEKESTERMLLLVQGISGSGKTYFSKKWAEEKPLERVRLNFDDIRTMLGKYWVPEREDLVESIFKHSLNLAMLKGSDIVIDNYSNLNPKRFKEFESIVEQFNKTSDIKYKIYTKVIDTPLEICIERDSKRDIPIGEKVIRSQYKKYLPFFVSYRIKQIPKLEQNVKLPHCIIVDLDGTLCYNTTGRPFFGPEAAERVHEDTLVEPIADLVTRFCNNEAVESEFIVITGRDESMRKATLDWLDDHWLYPSKLIMRSPKDFTSGPEYKLSAFNTYIKDKYFVEFVLDDMQSCVDMWRNLGLVCLQPNKGNL